MSDQQRKVYSFKSVGETITQRQERENTVTTALPIGIKTPLRLSQNDSSLFVMNTTLASQLRDNFKNMLSTNHGERYMLFDYGANLLPLAFELGSDDFDSLAIQNISTTTSKYMPYITLETFEPFKIPSEEGGLAKIGVRVAFSASQLGIENQVVETIIYAGG